MRYTINYVCLNNSEFNLIYQTNNYDQIEHFFWAMVLKLKLAHDKIDTNTWELTLFSERDGNKSYKYHFSKT